MFKLGFFCTWKRKKQPKKADEGTGEIVAQFEQYLNGILEKKLTSLVQEAVEKTISEIEKREPTLEQDKNPFAV